MILIKWEQMWFDFFSLILLLFQTESADISAWSANNGWSQYSSSTRSLSHITPMSSNYWGLFHLWEGRHFFNLLNVVAVHAFVLRWERLFQNSILLADINWATSWENLFLPYANDKGSDQPAHPRSLISAFVVHCLDSIIPLLAIVKILVEQASLSLNWSQTPKTGFLVTRLI